MTQCGSIMRATFAPSDAKDILLLKKSFNNLSVNFILNSISQVHFFCANRCSVVFIFFSVLSISKVLDHYFLKNFQDIFRIRHCNSKMLNIKRILLFCRAVKYFNSSAKKYFIEREEHHQWILKL